MSGRCPTKFADNKLEEKNAKLSRIVADLSSTYKVLEATYRQNGLLTGSARCRASARQRS
jgi:hypothetical protein